MGGRASKQKGSRAEYLLRDLLRANGYQSERIPLSGASAAMKGDVFGTREGKTIFFEVKSRRSEFASLYALADFMAKTNVTGLWSSQTGTCVGVGRDLGFVDSPDFLYTADTLFFALPGAKQHARAVSKLYGCKKWAADCQVVVLKNDRMPFLYLRFA